MSRNSIAVTGATVLLGLTLACTSKSSTPLTPTTPSTGGPPVTAADGSTLKVTAPVPVSPVSDQKPSTGPAMLTVSPSTGQFVGAIAVSYRYQTFNSANAMVDNAVVYSTKYEVATELVANSRYTWRARAEATNSVGPWSTTASFTAPETSFLGATEFADPLTNGKTVGIQHGGKFIIGQGWQSLAHEDGIDFDLVQPCIDNCKLEFDVTNFGPQEGLPDLKDLKWLSMAEPDDFSGFGVFRDAYWKMHLVQRADYPTGMEIVWRNGDRGDGTDPGDHRIKSNSTPISFSSANHYHFSLEWTTAGYSISVNDQEVFTEGWCCPYAPRVMRVSLGCYPRGDSFIGAIYSNIKLRRTK